MRGTVMRAPAAEHIIALAAIAVCVTGLAIYQAIANPLEADAGGFYRSGEAYLRHAPIYALAPSERPLSDPAATRPNLNPPTFTLAIFAPLAAVLSLRAAVIAWTAVGLAAFALSMWLIARELRLPAGLAVFTASVVLLLPGSGVAWEEGQPTWLLLYPMTRAWIAYRRNRRTSAGLWLAPVMAVKPFLAVALLPLGPAVATVAALGALLISTTAVAFTGWQPWRDWLATGATVNWLAFPMNASLPGTIARSLSHVPFAPVGVQDFPPLALIVWGAAAIAVMACATFITRQAPDTKWLSAFLGALFVAPLGWTYYLPILTGAGIAWYLAEHRGALTLAVVWSNWIPLLPLVPLLRYARLFPYAGSVYALALLGMWLAATSEGVRASRTAPQL